jgi:hypothetical protein
VKFSVHTSILLNNRECSPLGVNEGKNILPRGKISLLGGKFTSRGEVYPRGGRGEVKNGPLCITVYLRGYSKLVEKFEENL